MLWRRGRSPTRGRTSPTWMLTRRLQIIEVTRSVDENIKGAQVGKPITAKDDDTALLYSLTLADDSQYRRPGRVHAVRDQHQDGPDHDEGGLGRECGGCEGDTDDNEVTYTVTVTVSDPSGATTSQEVMITVNNVNDAPAFDADNDPTTLYVEENGTELTTDEDGDAALGGDRLRGVGRRCVRRRCGQPLGPVRGWCGRGLLHPQRCTGDVGLC